MPTQGHGGHLSAEQEAAFRRRSGDENTRTPVADTNVVDDALLSAAHRPGQTAAALEHAEGGARGQVVSHLQQSHGNSYVQRLVQRSAAPPGAAPEEDLAARIQSKSGGSSLDAGVQRQLESGLGADLSGVRIHTDAEADHLARSVNATAFTSGSDIFFRAGAYNPGSSEGLHTLAHEAAHTVQQASGPVDGTPTAGGVSVSDPGDHFEHAADEAAHHLVSGGSAPAVAGAGSAGSAAVQREEAAPEDEETKKKPEEDQPLV